MDEPKPQSSTPILEYSRSTTRPGSLLLANLVAIVGLSLWVIGFPLVLLGISGLFDSLVESPRAHFAASAVLLLVAMGIWYLAFRLCRSVRRIYTGG